MRKFFTLAALCLAALCANAQNEAGYTIRTLTFEDADFKGEKPTFGGEKSWSSLIDDPQYGGTLLYGGTGAGFSSEEEAYKWTDEKNTLLSNTLSEGYGSWCYWSGGHAISNYASADIKTNGGFSSQLTVYKKSDNLELVRTGGGHNGSDNFAVHFGYADNSSYSLPEASLPALKFADGTARVIDHMYVNNICYALNCYMNGNGLTAKIGPDDWVAIVAKGYNGDEKTGEAKIFLCNGPENIVTDWTKFDLSGLGKVTKVTFNVTGSSDNGYGFSQPAYFAYDDVAVRFDVTTGINSIQTTNSNKTTKPTDNAYYDLQGRRIAGPQKGMYIHNGKVYNSKSGESPLFEF